MDYQATRRADSSVRNITVVIDPPPEKFLIWEAQWKAYLASKGVSSGATNHWNWPVKSFLTGFKNEQALFVGAEIGGECQGLMQISWPTPSRIALGTETTHVEYLEIAPWNRPEVAGDRLYDRIGQSLLFVAYDFSETVGHNGRLTLSALPTSESFYHRINMSHVGVGTGTCSTLKFFEFTETHARAFRYG